VKTIVLALWLFASPAFAHGHRGVASGDRPMSMHAELWSFDIATAAEPRS